MDTNAPLHIGARIQCETDRGTIRYLGRITGRGETQWAGIEWDDEKRGKHCGTYNEREYFKCVTGSGSFLKLSKLGDGGRKTLQQAVQKRYIQDASDTSFSSTPLVVCGGLVSIVVQETRLQKQLYSVDVSGMGVSDLSFSHDTLPLINLQELSELHASSNLVDCSGSLHAALDAFPLLRLLNASRNHVPFSPYAGHARHGLQELVLNGCKIQWDGVAQLVGRTRLRVLRLHKCNLGRMGTHVSSLQTGLEMLETLDLSNNAVEWEDVMAISRLARLTELHISGNGLGDTELGDGMFPALKTLGIGDNKLQGWKVVSWMNGLERLGALRIAGNPICKDGDRLTWRMRVVGRIARVEVLDGSVISKDERLLCEKRYAHEEVAKAVRKGDTKGHPRTAELLEKYGEGGGREGIRTEMVRVRMMAGEDVGARRREVVRDMPLSAEMDKVRVVAGRLLRVCGDFTLAVRLGERLVPAEGDRQLQFWSGADSQEVIVICHKN